MKIKPVVVLLLLVPVLISSCTPATENVKTQKITEVQKINFVEGTVRDVSGNTLTAEIGLPEFDTSTLPFANRIAQEVTNRCFLLENTLTRAGGQKVRVDKISEDAIVLEFDAKPKFKPGDPIKIAVPKKTIAIVDFDVIRGHDPSIGVVFMESLTTALVNSGQFNVVERYKLKTILEELKLGTAGLTEPDRAKQFGKLLQADLIFTGSFANLGEYWNTNLRLINVSTGLIVAALEEKVYHDEIKPSAARDSTRLNETWEGQPKPGWVIASWQRYRAKTSLEVDRGSGAENTSSSLKMSFEFIGNSAFAPILNNRKRDLSLFSGIEFYAKADRKLNVVFAMTDENPGENDKRDRWYAVFEVGTEWEKHRVKFDDLSIAPPFARKFPGGDGVLSLHLVNRFDFNVNDKVNPPGTIGKLWIDEIRFY